jgi:hypothetical protein
MESERSSLGCNRQGWDWGEEGRPGREEGDLVVDWLEEEMEETGGWLEPTEKDLLTRWLLPVS